MIVWSVGKGITLIETLVVVAILSILTATSFIVVSPQINKAFDARRKADLHSVKTNLEFYYSIADQYPNKLPDCGQPLIYKNQSILDSMPCDPTTRKPYYYQIKGGNQQSYRLYTLLSNTHDFSISDVGCLGGCGPDCSFNYGVSSANVGLTRCSYVCAPGGGKLGACELFQDASISLCPKIYDSDSTCNNECSAPKNRCQNASGKHVPY